MIANDRIIAQYTDANQAIHLLSHEPAFIVSLPRKNMLAKSTFCNRIHFACISAKVDRFQGFMQLYDLLQTDINQKSGRSRIYLSFCKVCSNASERGAQNVMRSPVLGCVKAKLYAWSINRGMRTAHFKLGA